MSLQLSIKGGKTQLSGNRIQVEIQTDSLTGIGYNLLLKTTSVDESFPEGIDAIEPDKDKKAVFDIRNRVTLPIEYSFTWPLDGSISVEHPQMAKRVALDIGERYVEVINNENKDQVNWSELDGEDYQVLILKGGLSKHEQAKYNERNTTFYNEFIGAGRFLTMLPDNLRISPHQPVKLWFITKETTEQALTLKVEYERLDGTTGNLTHPVTINPGTITEQCADPASLGLNSGLCSSYTISLEKDGISVSEERTFNIDHQNYENNTFLLYANKVGGIDCAWFSGEIKKLFPTKSQTSEREAGITDSQKRPTIEVDVKSGKRKWEINTGYKTSEEMEALRDLFESRNVWLLQNNDTIPVILDDGDNSYYDSMEDLHNITLTISEAH